MNKFTDLTLNGKQEFDQHRDADAVSDHGKIKLVLPKNRNIIQVKNNLFELNLDFTKEYKIGDVVELNTKKPPKLELKAEIIDINRLKSGSIGMIIFEVIRPDPKYSEEDKKKNSDLLFNTIKKDNLIHGETNDNDAYLNENKKKQTHPMKRKDIVAKLMTEGFSEKTLAGMTDKQLGIMISRVLPEQYNPTGTQSPVNVSKTDVNSITQLKQQKKPFATYEGEVKEMEGPKLGTEPKKLTDKEDAIKRLKFKIKHDKDNGKVEDFKKLLAKLTKEKEHELNERHGGKSPTGAKTHTPKTDAGGKPKDDNDDEKSKSFADQRWNAPRRKGKLKEWVNKLVVNKIYPSTSKNEIMELIHIKLTEQKPQEHPHTAEPDIEVEPDKKTKPDVDPDDPFRDPHPGINPNPKAKKKHHKISAEDAKDKIIALLKKKL